jgi:methionine biosynthesis protein MetW
LLNKYKNVKAQGIEFKEELIYKCVEKGLNVLHSDIDTGLNEYPDKSFDYVILNQSMQEMKNVDFVINEALRVGNKVIVGFSNFAYIGARIQLALFGRAPVTPSLPYSWHATPNLHFLSLKDFLKYCQNKNIKIVKSYYFSKRRLLKLFPNVFSETSVILISK